MDKKIWYEIELINVRNADITETKIVARVKSKGLAQIIYNRIKEVY